MGGKILNGIADFREKREREGGGGTLSMRKKYGNESKIRFYKICSQNAKICIRITKISIELHQTVQQYLYL